MRNQIHAIYEKLAVVNVAGLVEAPRLATEACHHLPRAKRNGQGEMNSRLRIPNWEAM